MRWVTAEISTRNCNASSGLAKAKEVAANDKFRRVGNLATGIFPKYRQLDFQRPAGCGADKCWSAFPSKLRAFCRSAVSIDKSLFSEAIASSSDRDRPSAERAASQSRFPWEPIEPARIS